MLDKFTIKELLFFIILMMPFKAAFIFITLSKLKKLEEKIGSVLKDNVLIYKTITKAKE